MVPLALSLDTCFGVGDNLKLFLTVRPYNEFMNTPSVPIFFACLAAFVTLIGNADRPAAGAEVVVSHPVSITQADVFVGRTKMTIRLKAFADDLELLQGVEPYEDGSYDSDELREAMRDHGAFLLERIDIFDASGARLDGKIVEYDAFDIPPEGLISGQLMQHTIGYRVEYAYDQAPEYLTFQHEIVDENFLYPSELKMLVKQAGSDAPYAANVKPQTPETIRFDWDRPLQREASGEELRDWFDEQREKTLGITSYGSVYSFIYITPTEVRQEVLIPLANLAAMVDFQQADPAYLEVEEQGDARQLIEALFSEGNPVEIDGDVVPPRFDRVDFYGLDLRDFAMQAEQRRVNLANGRVGIIMAYPTKSIPNHVRITWDKFSKTLKDVEVIVFAIDKTEKAKFSTYLTENTYEWNNPGIEPLPEVVAVDFNVQPRLLTIPIVTIECGIFALLFTIVAVCGLNRRESKKGITLAILFVILGILTIPFFHLRVPMPAAFSPPISSRQADAVFKDLHHTLFRAFDYYEEDDVYDALAATTHGDLLRDFYLNMRKSLEVKEQGGAVAKIDEVKILSGEIAAAAVGQKQLEDPEFAYRCKWNLLGTIEHWGHIHQRTNTYDAVFNVENVDGTWKLTDFETIDEQQGRVKTSLRKF